VAVLIRTARVALRPEESRAPVDADRFHEHPQQVLRPDDHPARGTPGCPTVPLDADGQFVAVVGHRAPGNRAVPAARHRIRCCHPWRGSLFRSFGQPRERQGLLPRQLMPSGARSTGRVPQFVEKSLFQAGAMHAMQRWAVRVDRTRVSGTAVFDFVACDRPRRYSPSWGVAGRLA